MNLAPILPELILTAGSIILMMVAAFLGRVAERVVLDSRQSVCVG